jgi:dUTP pyrophosphatase
MKVQRLVPNAIIPSRATPQSAGYDIYSVSNITVSGRGRSVVPTGLAISVPDGTYARIAPRSGLAIKYGVDIGAGVIDADYRGEIGVIIFNHGTEPFEIVAGDRIAQIIIERIETPNIVEVNTLDNTLRGINGFGSTGK